MIKIPKSKLLIALGIIVIVSTLTLKVAQLNNWQENDWEVTGVSALYGPMIIVWAFAYMGILYFHKVPAPSLWLMGVAGLGFGIIATWMVNL